VEIHEPGLPHKGAACSHVVRKQQAPVDQEPTAMLNLFFSADRLSLVAQRMREYL
jgi:hypothetical protein